MAKYRFGVIFNLDRHLKGSDPTGMFTNVNREKLLREIVTFLTEDIISIPEARETINEIEYLLSVLHHQEIIDDYIFELDEPYVKICGVLFAICESVLDIFEEVRLFDYIRERGTRPVRVIPISRDNFAIVVKHPLRNENSNFCHKAKTILRRIR